MPQELTINLLAVARHEEPPSPEHVARALAAAGLGSAAYTPAPARPAADSTPSPRQRIGTYTVAIPTTQSTARLLVFRYSSAVTLGMGEAAFSALTRGIAPEDVQTLRNGTLALDLRLQTDLTQTAPTLGWAMQTLRVLLDLTDGVVIDPAAQRCYGRAELSRFGKTDPLAHIALHTEAWNAETRWLHTHGMQKFGQPELDLVAVPLALATEGMSFLREVAAGLVGRARLMAGAEIDMDDLGSVVAIGAAADVDHQAPFGRVRLADSPLPGERQGNSAQRLLARMALTEANRRAAVNDIPGALEDIERVLAADPDDGDALMLRARLYLHSGNATAALDVGEYLELRLPRDFRGPLVRGLALAAQGRYREALHALDRAIEREPEAAEAFAVRADVHERLGHERLAAVDRTHAAYLSV